ncbi:centrosomal and chromosomal factor-like [Drosophila busckii]|uniref:centrosomal and chromosomal factor-like n=1 Tax=Drosophila busckii TaxID=30019 RepID=UPI00083F4161|nr:centrosomal and chromosomal factor-like [Drosophila busckii]
MQQQQQQQLLLQQQQQHDDKRYDVHYLLKQLNSFSDIEEIEIVDMKQRQQQQQQQQQQHRQQQQSQAQPQPQQAKPATASSLELMSLPALAARTPSSQSHKGNFMLGVDAAGGSTQRLQFDDYLFESCHYLETNYFAANYRTAMVESSSHEFRHSTTTPTSTRSESFELHEMQPASVNCQSLPPPPMGMPQQQAEVRLTSSGVQTELSSSKHEDEDSPPSSSSTAAFFSCCYTPIGRWRQRRLDAHKASSSHPV